VSLVERVILALQKEIPAAVTLRHRLHMDPCLPGVEDPTATTVAGELGWGEGVRVADTGRLIRAVPGAVVLRAELDALPVTEQTGVPWSATGAAMHACGHDVHLAAVVAAARAIASCEPDVPVAVLLQPREEIAPSGAKDVAESGALQRAGVRAIVAAHVQPQLRPGVIGVRPGLVNASVDEFELIVRGHGGHAAYPHTARDPVVAAAAIVIALQHLASRRVDPVHGAVCTIGRICGGTAPNVIPDEVSMLGTLRVMHPELRPALLRALRDIARTTAESYACTVEMIPRSDEPPLVNDVALAAATALHLQAADLPVDVEWRSFGSDDFSYYGADFPSLMAFVGVDGGAGLHEPRFLPPDDTVGLVARVLVAAYLAAADVPPAVISTDLTQPSGSPTK
jgi:amidohydrolase